MKDRRERTSSAGRAGSVGRAGTAGRGVPSAGRAPDPATQVTPDAAEVPIEVRPAPDFSEPTIRLAPEFESQANAYIDLLMEWNERLNLVSRRMTRDDLLRHVLGSLAPLELLEAAGPTAADFSLLDIGSGGGLPALPLLLARPTWKGVLVEGMLKKCRFLREAATRLVPGRARVIQARYEELPGPGAEVSEDPEFGPTPELVIPGNTFQMITMRAVAPDRKLVNHISEQVRVDLAVGGWMVWFASRDEAIKQQALDALARIGLEDVRLVRVDWADTTLATGRGPAR
ncbi:MAG: class I SAM-dependent methyltransferase [Candidatus Eisenbacteria bacterium]|nr:class I SAM-dependent methyltransferase [Candidatus Eisenbacteria bacterium]